MSNANVSAAPSQRQIAEFLRNVAGLGCNCDLDNWQPEESTGHSCVCRIHRIATSRPHDISLLIARIREHAALEQQP